MRGKRFGPNAEDECTENAEAERRLKDAAYAATVRRPPNAMAIGLSTLSG